MHTTVLPDLWLIESTDRKPQIQRAVCKVMRGFSTLLVGWSPYLLHWSGVSYIFLLYFVLPPFKDDGLLFWAPDVLCSWSEVVLWSLLSVQMFFQWICRGESGLLILFLRHLSSSSQLYISKAIMKYLLIIPKCLLLMICFYSFHSHSFLLFYMVGDFIFGCCISLLRLP